MISRDRLKLKYFGLSEMKNVLSSLRMMNARCLMVLDLPPDARRCASWLISDYNKRNIKF